MENKIVIKSVTFKPTSTGKDKWTVEGTNGKYSVWDGKIAEQLNSAIGKEAECEVRPDGTGKYLPTITAVRGINDVSPSAATETASTRPVANPTSKDKSIVAQCLVKASCSTAEAMIPIKNVVEMYKKALELL